MRARKTMLSIAVGLGVLGLAVVTIRAGGSLEPTAPPGPTMHTLEDIYNKVGPAGGGGVELTGPTAAAMARDIGYLEINSGAIPGESEDSAHPDWIEVLAVYYSARQPAGAGAMSVGGRAGRRAQFSDITLVKELDKASPKLYLACAKGEHIPEIVIEFTRQAGAVTVVYHRITLLDAYVTAISPVMTHRTDAEYVHLEEIALSYGSVEWEYTQFDSAGQAMGTVKSKWSVSENTVPVGP